MNIVYQLRQSNDLKIVVITCLYILTANFAFYFAFPVTKGVPFWPAAGLSLAVMLLYSPKVWPAIAIGSLVAGILLFNHFGISLSIDTTYALLFLMIISISEALLGYYLLQKWINSTNPFLKTSHAFAFILVVLAISVVGASIFALVFTAGNIFPNSGYFSLLTTYFCASAVGNFVMAPFILSWKKNFSLHINKVISIEIILFFVALSLVFYPLTVESLADPFEKSFPFLIMPFLLWIAFRGNAQLTMLVVVCLAFLATYFTVNGEGPFILLNEKSSLLMLQIFISISAITGLILNTTVWERTTAEKSIRQFNEKLEENVQRRTKELHDEIAIRRAAEEKIKVSNRMLRKANAELDNFVYSVSHDLRAPIASVLGLVNLSDKETDAEMLKKYLGLIGKSAKQQDAFIKDILNISRNARLEVAQDVIEFQEIVNETFEQFQYYNINKNVQKQIEIHQEGLFHSDKKRLKVILNNIISNAIRYSNHNEPKISIKINVDEATAKIQIQDNGVGIEKKHLKKVFNMFYRATDDNAGSGLGLYIVKETVDKLRGNVSLKSKESQGTTVNIELPNLCYN